MISTKIPVRPSLNFWISIPNKLLHLRLTLWVPDTLLFLCMWEWMSYEWMLYVFVCIYAAHCRGQRWGPATLDLVSEVVVSCLKWVLWESSKHSLLLSYPSRPKLHSCRRGLSKNCYTSVSVWYFIIYKNNENLYKFFPGPKIKLEVLYWNQILPPNSRTSKLYLAHFICNRRRNTWL